jgi:hypothetical protein
MSYTFRLRLNRSLSPTLNTDAREINIAVPEQVFPCFFGQHCPLAQPSKMQNSGCLLVKATIPKLTRCKQGSDIKEITGALAKVQLGAGFWISISKKRFYMPFSSTSDQRRAIPTFDALSVLETFQIKIFCNGR